MEYKKILAGDISNHKEMMLALELFNESTDKDSLSKAIISKWEELGKPYIGLTEASSYFEYAPNEMKVFSLNEANEYYRDKDMNDDICIFASKDFKAGEIIGKATDMCLNKTVLGIYTQSGNIPNTYLQTIDDVEYLTAINDISQGDKLVMSHNDKNVILHENISSQNVYYGITQDEIDHGYIEYHHDSKYDGKGVNLSLRGLIKFLADNDMVNDIKHYTVISKSEFEVLENIDYDEEYDMICVKTPFKIQITNTHMINYEVLEECTLNESTTSTRRLYHLSENDLDGKVLHPRVPHNCMTRDGRENDKIPRICFAPSIVGCLIGITGDLTGKEFYVHVIDESYSKPEIKHITNDDVPEQFISKEVWVLNDVKLKKIGKVKVTETFPKKYKQGRGSMTNNCYKWKHINECVLNEFANIDFVRNYPAINAVATKFISSGQNLEELSYIKNDNNDGDFFHQFDLSKLASCIEYGNSKNSNVKLVKIDDTGFESYKLVTCKDIKKGQQLCVDFNDYTKYFGDRYDYFVNDNDIHIEIKESLPINESTLDESIISNEPTEPIYVLLTHSGTALANAIKTVTRVAYSHASISFDSTMENIYSFGRKYIENGKMVGTFVKESLYEGLYKNRHEAVTYGLYVTFVTPAEKMFMQNRILEFWKRQQEKPFKYSFKGLLNIAVGRETHSEEEFFCSQFVDMILKAANDYTNKHSSLVKPFDFAKCADFYEVTNGIIKDYSKAQVDILVKKIYKEKQNEIIERRNNIEDVINETIDISNFKEFVPSPYYSYKYMISNTNGGVYNEAYKIIKERRTIRPSMIDQVYDPSVNRFYKKRIPDNSHIIFAINLMIWLYDTQEYNLIESRIIVDEWNRRIKSYYDRMASIARDEHMHPSNTNDEYFMYAQMLDDIMWNTNTCPYNDKVREYNLQEFLNPNCVDLSDIREAVDSIIVSDPEGLAYTYQDITAVSPIEEDIEKTSIFDEEFQPSEIEIVTTPKKDNMLNESTYTQSYQQELLTCGHVDIKNIFQSICESPELDVDALFFMNSLIESTYIYGIQKENASSVIALRSDILNLLSENAGDNFMDNFKKSIYYPAYTELESKIKDIRILNKYCLNK